MNFIYYSILYKFNHISFICDFENKKIFNPKATAIGLAPGNMGGPWTHIFLVLFSQTSSFLSWRKFLSSFHLCCQVCPFSSIIYFICIYIHIKGINETDKRTYWKDHRPQPIREDQEHQQEDQIIEKIIENYTCTLNLLRIHIIPETLWNLNQQKKRPPL